VFVALQLLDSKQEDEKIQILETIKERIQTIKIQGID